MLHHNSWKEEETMEDRIESVIKKVLSIEDKVSISEVATMILGSIELPNKRVARFVLSVSFKEVKAAMPSQYNGIINSLCNTFIVNCLSLAGASKEELIQAAKDLKSVRIGISELHIRKKTDKYDA